MIEIVRDRATALPLVTARVLAGVVLLWAAVKEATRADGQGGSPSRVSERLQGKDIARQMPPLEHPECRSAPRATHMRAEDLILGVLVSGRARAYPWWIPQNDHVVTDTL